MMLVSWFGMDNSIMAHANMRVCEYGGRRFVVEVTINRQTRGVSVRCAPGIAPLAGAIAEKIVLSEGWSLGGGGSYGYSLGPVNTETGNGRFQVIEYGKGGVW